MQPLALHRRAPADPRPTAVPVVQQRAVTSSPRNPMDRLFLAAFGLVGLALGARPISDNSTFVHLRTGIDIVAGRGIPRVDPYSATAAGSDWVVQSWLPASVYGLAVKIDEVGRVLLVLNGLLTALLALLVYRLARAGSPLRTLGAALVAVAVSGPWWSPRPLLVGLACLALTMLVVESGRRPWLLLPIAWVWVNSHGSFPLGALWLGAVVVGSAIDERRLVTARFRSALWFAGGLVLAAVNPLGPKLLLFPLVVGDRREVFRSIVEWKSANFQSGRGVVAALGLGIAVIVLSRARIPWRAILPAGLFVLLGLLAQRNLAPAGIVLAPALGLALNRARQAEEVAGGERGPEEPSDDEDRARDEPRAVGAPARRNRALAALMGAAAVLVVANAISTGSLNLKPYPIEVIEAGERLGAFAPGQLVAAQDMVGCYLVLRRGRDAGVFIDDRYDMYPLEVSMDYKALLDGTRRGFEALDRRGVDSVLWQRSLPLVPALQDRGWREVAGDERWVLLQRP